MNRKSRERRIDITTRGGPIKQIVLRNKAFVKQNLNSRYFKSFIILPKQIWTDASNDWTRYGRHDPARKGDVVLPDVHGDVLLVQRLLRSGAGTEKGGPIVRHGTRRKKIYR